MLVQVLFRTLLAASTRRREHTVGTEDQKCRGVRGTREHTYVRWAGAGAGGWSGVREKYYCLDGGWKLVLERCEKKNTIGLESAGVAEQSD